MKLGSPWLLALSLAGLVVLVGYLWWLRRGKRNTTTFSSLGLLREAASGQKPWRRHVPVVLICAALVVLGVGAAGVAISKLLLAEGVGDIIGINRNGIISEEDPRLDKDRRWLAAHTNKGKRTGSFADAMVGADVFIGVSGSNLVSEDNLKVMAKDSIVFALANPDPEVDPQLARRYAAIVATGRSDEPNQINNVLAFPGIFRGLLDAGASQVTEEVEIAAGRAIADREALGALGGVHRADSLQSERREGRRCRRRAGGTGEEGTLSSRKASKLVNVNSKSAVSPRRASSHG